VWLNSLSFSVTITRSLSSHTCTTRPTR
jgi:hypothetical protein